MKQWSRIVSAAALAVAAVALAAPAAHANSFTDREMFGGIYSYSDSGDKFCVTVKNVSGISITVTLRPDTAPSRGPEFNYTVGAGRTVCKSLATAYEDTATSSGSTRTAAPRAPTPPTSSTAEVAVTSFRCWRGLQEQCQR